MCSHPNMRPRWPRTGWPRSSLLLRKYLRRRKPDRNHSNSRLVSLQRLHLPRRELPSQGQALSIRRLRLIRQTLPRRPSR